MSLVTERVPASRRAPPEIAVEASSAFAQGPGFDELWGRPGRGAPPSRADVRRGGGFGALGVVLAIAAATGAIGLRAPIVRALPTSAVVYEAAGLPVNLAGLALRDVRARILRDGDRRILVAEGEIVNLRRRENRAPPLALAVRGANGLQRYAWTAPAPKTTLEPGEAVAFRARLAAPPEDGVEVVVRFARLEPASP
jgi:hypothetical protein